MPSFNVDYLLCRMVMSTTTSASDSDSNSDTDSDSDSDSVHTLLVSGFFRSLGAETQYVVPHRIPRQEFFSGSEQSILALLTDLGISSPPQRLVDAFTLMLSELSQWVSTVPHAAAARLLRLRVSINPSNAEGVELGSLELALRESEAFADQLPGFGAVPADDKAIEALPEPENCEECDQGVCCVCMENFDDDCDDEDQDRTVVKMPCCHYYHKNCIAPWLKKSHLCPLCRTPMPISTLRPQVKETIEVEDDRDIIFDF